MLCLFYSCPPLFRGWTGEGREAGSYQSDASRNIYGGVAWLHSSTGPTSDDGTSLLYWNVNNGIQRNQLSTDYNGGNTLMLDASRVVPTAGENRPVNIAVPVILYLGLPD